MLSKTTVNSVITVIRDNIRQWISEEVENMFAVEIDTTQDISAQDHCSVVLRYVDSGGTIQERLVSVMKCEESTGESFVKLVLDIMLELNLDLKNCVGNSTDGSANMQGHYNGFSSLLAKEAPHQIHIWCHSHVLNLVISETTSTAVTSATLFSLLNDIAIFFRDSYDNETTRNYWRNKMVVKGLCPKKSFWLI